MGDVANLARHTDRLDNVESTLIRIERKLDVLAAALLPPAKAMRK
jgi:hypothetical protein